MENQNSNHNSKLYNIWLWWIGLTVLYLLTQILLKNLAFGPDVTRIIIGFIGLFVPIGYLSFMGLWIGAAYSWVALPVLLLFLYAAARVQRSLHLNRSLNIIYNLVALLILTLITDLIIWHTWNSINIIFNPPHIQF